MSAKKPSAERGTKIAGAEIQVDPGLEPGTAELRSPDGSVAARIENIGVEPDAHSAGGKAGEHAAEVPVDKGAKPFFDPAEAARIRWDRDRARKAAEAEHDAQSRSGEVVVIRTTVETGAVINRLARDAKAGNVQAARELRAYLSEVQVESDTDVSALDRKTRQRVMGRLLSEIEAEDALATDSPS